MSEQYTDLRIVPQKAIITIAGMDVYVLSVKIPELGYQSPPLFLSAHNEEEADVEATWHLQNLMETMAERFGVPPERVIYE